VHHNGQKIGIYLNPGLAKAAVNKNTPVEGTNCRALDIAHHPLVNGNQFGDTYKINYSHPCAQAYTDSFARLLVSWGVDFLKLDAVGPGSDALQYDTREDVRSWHLAFQKTGKEVWLELSWKLDVRYINFWKEYANGWRVEDDVDCYCDTMLTWVSVKRVFQSVQPFIPYAGKGGWNDLDSVNVGNGAISGLSNGERQSYATLWAISATPFYTGNDLTKLDAYGLSLLTNPEVIRVIHQGKPAKPLHPTDTRSVWFVKNQDNRSYTVALFNLDDHQKAEVTVNWKDIGLTGNATVRDIWARRNLRIYENSFSAELHPHASRLLRLTPQ